MERLGSPDGGLARDGAGSWGAGAVETTLLGMGPVRHRPQPVGSQPHWALMRRQWAQLRVGRGALDIAYQGLLSCWVGDVQRWLASRGGVEPVG